MKDFTIADQTLTREQISDVLCSAFEGGSNSWYWIDQFIAPASWDFVSEPSLLPGERHWPCDYPLNPGGALVISSTIDQERPGVRLELDVIQRGLNILVEKYPWHFANILSENADAETGDVLLQCCLFGEIIYG
jgi:hypothetical protein